MWSSANKAKKCGSLFAPGIYTTFGEFVWQYWIVAVAILIREFKHWVNNKMLWGLTCQWVQSGADQPFSWKFFVIIWAVGIGRS